MPTKLTMIQGSPRAGGNTERAVRLLSDRLEQRFDVSTVNLYDRHIRRCEGCRRCMVDGVCAIRDDDFPALWAELHASEVVVQACPVYWHSPPGIMKDFVDRTHSTYLDKRSFAGVRAYLLTVAADSGFQTCETVTASWITSYGGKVLGRTRLLARDLGELEDRAQNLRLLEELAASILAGSG
jgi:multimeric flavodoxin WrbA